MRGAKTIVAVACFVLAAVTVNAQEQRYELSEAKVAPGFYLAPDGYEFQLPQYGLSMTMPPQSYYKVPYLLKHNAYLNTSASVVSYCLYKYYLSNSYTDFALFSSYTGNMRLKVAELKDNDKNEFLESLKKKKDFRSHRSFRTSLATYTHYSALNDAGEGRAHGYYYLTDNILIEVIAIPRDDGELRKFEDIIRTLRKVDLQKDLDDYLAMLASLRSTVEQKDINFELTKEEEEIEVLYEQEQTTPTMVAQPTPSVEPPVNNTTTNTQAIKNTSELAAMLRKQYAGTQQEDVDVEVVDVKIVDVTELVVFKGGYIKPPQVEIEDVDVQLMSLPVFNLAIVQQKTVKMVEGNLLPIYPIVKRPEVVIGIVDVPSVLIAATNNLKNILPGSSARIEKSLLAITLVAKRPDISMEDIKVSEPDIVLASNTNLNTSTAVAQKTLIATMAPVEKRPEVSMDIDVAEIAITLASNSNLNTSAAEKTLISTITPIEKKPEVTIDIDNFEATPTPIAVESKEFTVTASNAEKNLLAINSVEKRPEVPVDVGISQTVGLPADNVTVNTLSTENSFTSTITTVVKQPDLTLESVRIPSSKVSVSSKTNELLTSAANIEKLLLPISPVKKRAVSTNARIEESTSPTAIALADNSKTVPLQNAIENEKTPEKQSVGNETEISTTYVVTEEVAQDYWDKVEETATVHQPKFINLLDSPVIEEKKERKKLPTIVDNIKYTDITSATSQSEMVNFRVAGNKSLNTANENVEKSSVEQNSEKTENTQQEVTNRRERCTRSAADIVLSKIEGQVIPYSRVQQKPTFNGGTYNNFALWVGDNTCYPEGLRENIDGYVTVEIVVGSDGFIGNVNVMSSPHKLLETEVLYVLSISPKWVPGMQDGKPVATSVVIGVPVSAYL